MDEMILTDIENKMCSVVTEQGGCEIDADKNCQECLIEIAVEIIKNNAC